MLKDPLYDRFVRQRKRQQSYEPEEIGPRKRRKGQPQSGILNGANNIVMNQPMLIENTIENQTQITHNCAAGKPVLERIAQYADLDATVDSSARFPPPSCHPGTRSKIGDRLLNWLMDHKRQWNMIWLHGPAGTGKSAVAQTFAERCAKDRRLGASFFFSRPNARNRPDTVIPSLIYQLAVRLPHYKSLVAAELANDPELFRKSRRSVFNQLIVEPFSQLQAQRQKRIREPLLIVLDGLDECEGEDAQHDIIEMISEVVRLKPDFPLVWLICSRPEAHLKYLFSRADFTISCGREELVIDAESIDDVDLYLRDGLAGIRDHFGDVTTPTWPSEKQFTDLSQKAAGHFGFASTALQYIGDVAFAAPMARLDELLSFLKGARVGSSNPMEALDALYTGILLGVPNEVVSTIKRILGFYLYRDNSTSSIICNFLSIDQVTFYHAFRKLHSVIDIPSPKDVYEKRLRFYHASFQDYLRDPSRSGQFAIVGEDFDLEFAKLCLFWYKTDLTLSHTADGSAFDESYLHRTLPGLTWISDDNRACISNQVADFAKRWCWFACGLLGKWDEALLSQIRHFDFRYIQKNDLGGFWSWFVRKLWEVDPVSGIIRTEPRSEVDLRLLKYMKSMIEPVLTCRPATFPLNPKMYDLDGGEYFLVGYDSHAIVCWAFGREREECYFSALNFNEAPSKEQIELYQAWLIGGEDRGSSDEGRDDNDEENSNESNSEGSEREETGGLEDTDT